MKNLKILLVMLLAVIGLSTSVNAEVIHIYMSESIEGQTFYRNNVGDTFELHWSDEIGVYAWSWSDSGGVFDASPNETTTLGADFVDGVAYDQSSTETGYSYYVIFYIEDPVVNTYDAIFTVTDGTNPISGATVTVTGEGSQVTIGSGVCTFTDLADGDYDYTVTATGYDDYNSSFTVNGSNVAVDVVMTETAAPVYDVNFSVNAASKGITGATVSLEGYGEEVTDGSGNCSFTDVPDGTYDYDVLADGYQNASGWVTVNGGNVQENVYMDPLGLHDMTEIELNVYPNPCTDYLTIAGVSNVQWAVYSITGQVVKTGNGERIGMSNLNSGYYMLKVITDEGSVVKKILKQ